MAGEDYKRVAELYRLLLQAPSLLEFLGCARYDNHINPSLLAEIGQVQCGFHQLPPVQGGGKWQHFERHASAERDLLDLVDHAHATADLSEDTEVPEADEQAPRRRAAKKLLAQLRRHAHGLGLVWVGPAVCKEKMKRIGC